MAREIKHPRERAARAMCSHFDIPENIVRDKKPTDRLVRAF